ncbi:MAG: hypothetical protein WBW16_09435 [Bacteroidota bacterium]
MPTHPRVAWHYGLGELGRMFDPLFGRGELGKMFEPLFGLGELGKIFEPLFFVDNASPAYDSAKLVKTARATVTITARNRFLLVCRLILSSVRWNEV